MEASNYKLSDKIYYKEYLMMNADAVECKLLFYHPNTIHYYRYIFALEYLHDLFENYKFEPLDLRLK